MRTFVLDGLGIAALSNFIVGDDIRAGRLQHLLPDYACGSAGIYAVYQDRRYQQIKVRLFIDFIQKTWQDLSRQKLVYLPTGGPNAPGVLPGSERTENTQLTRQRQLLTQTIQRPLLATHPEERAAPASATRLFWKGDARVALHA